MGSGLTRVNANEVPSATENGRCVAVGGSPCFGRAELVLRRDPFGLAHQPYAHPRPGIETGGSSSEWRAARRIGGLLAAGDHLAPLGITSRRGVADHPQQSPHAFHECSRKEAMA